MREEKIKDRWVWWVALAMLYAYVHIYISLFLASMLCIDCRCWCCGTIGFTTAWSSTPHSIVHVPFIYIYFLFSSLSFSVHITLYFVALKFFFLHLLVICGRSLVSPSTSSLSLTTSQNELIIPRMVWLSVLAAHFNWTLELNIRKRI